MGSTNLNGTVIAVSSTSGTKACPLSTEWKVYTACVPTASERDMEKIETQLMQGYKAHKGTHALREQTPIKWCQDSEDFFQTDLQLKTKCIEGKCSIRLAVNH